jgi:putative autoinducer-2 (AI-2) aldolase
MADLDDIKDGKDFGIGTPQQNVPYTLKGCGSLDWGMQSRLARIFNPQSNRTVMLAFDHGYFQGPTTGLERIDLSIAPLFGETDVLMCTRGILGARCLPPPTNRWCCAPPAVTRFWANCPTSAWRWRWKMRCA